MPLQNRVDPFGDIHAVEWRGMFTGNRGVIHDPDTKTLLRRRWTTKAWIICTCRYKDVRREPMGCNTHSGSAGWTELFFLDEVTALAAGHRPCFTCRREKAKAFVRGYGEAFGIVKPGAPEMDSRLHGERQVSGGAARALDLDGVRRLPDGAIFANEDRPYAVRGGKALPWSFGGYGLAVDFPKLPTSGFRLMTPPTTLRVLEAGYRPVWHPSA